MAAVAVAMALSPGRQTLERLLDGERLTAVDLDTLIKTQPQEDESLDYKNGLLTKDRDEARKIVRRWVSGFANATGGVLVLGVSEAKPRTVTGCTRIGGQPLDEWAARVLQDMAGYFSPQPQIQVIAHSAGEVLVIGVARAPGLVQCVESRELKYYFRIGESTVEATDYLIADLVLGRRNHPYFDVSCTRLDLLPTQIRPMTSGAVYHGLEVRIEVRLDNESLVTAKRIQVGIVGWSIERDEPRVSRQLKGYVDAEVAPNLQLADAPPWRLYAGPPEVPAEARALSYVGATVGRLTVPHLAAKLTCGLFVLPEGHPPSWFTAEIEIPAEPSTTGKVQIQPTQRATLRWSRTGS